MLIKFILFQKATYTKICPAIGSDTLVYSNNLKAKELEVYRIIYHS